MEALDARRGLQSGAPGDGLRRAMHLSEGHERGHHGGRGGERPGFDARGRQGGRGGHGGPRVGKGDVRAAALLLLDERPLHGYQIIQLIAERSNGIWRPSAGSVYPALQLLEDEAFVRSEPEEGRRVYHLTDAGRAYVEERREELTAARDAVTETVGEGWVELHDAFHQVGTALKQVAQVGTPAQIAAARELLAQTRRHLYRILADEEPAGTTDRP
jgi:DNA-binding PadR family transcriptional regulator